jgi:hypothetical protein
MAAASLVGVMRQGSGAVLPGAAGLYEFWTDRGERVSLHDADLRTITWRPGPQPSLVLVFEYDAQWLPPELDDRRFVSFSCRDVRILTWEEDTEAYEEAVASHQGPDLTGQVRAFEWDGQDFFALSTHLLYPCFRATSVTVATSSSPQP